MSSTSWRCNTNERGSSYERRRRKLWLLSERAGWGGDGDTVPCWECGVLLEYEDVVPDRLIPGEHGGRYTRDNIAPHCILCSCRQGQRRYMRILEWRYRSGWMADQIAGTFFGTMHRSGRTIVTRLPDPALL